MWDGRWEYGECGMWNVECGRRTMVLRGASLLWAALQGNCKAYDGLRGGREEGSRCHGGNFFLFFFLLEVWLRTGFARTKCSHRLGRANKTRKSERGIKVGNGFDDGRQACIERSIGAVLHWKEVTIEYLRDRNWATKEGQDWPWAWTVGRMRRHAIWVVREGVEEKESLGRSSQRDFQSGYSSLSLFFFFSRLFFFSSRSHLFFSDLAVLV